MITPFIKTKASTKLIFMTVLGLCSTLLVIILIKVFDQIEVAILLGGVLLGISYSSIYPLIFVVASEQNLEVGSRQAIMMVTVGVAAEGFLTMVTGILMEAISINMLFYTSLIVNLLLLGSNHFSLDLLKSQRKEID